MVHDVTRIATGNKFLTWQFPLHNGDALGLIGCWLVFDHRLAPGLLFFTGFYLWWKKRQLANGLASAVGACLQANKGRSSVAFRLQAGSYRGPEPIGIQGEEISPVSGMAAIDPQSQLAL